MTDLHCQIIRAASQPLAPLPTGQEEIVRPLPGIRAVLFDVYGTLFVSGCGDIAVTTQKARGQAVGAAFYETLAEQGFSPEDVEHIAPDATPDSIGRALMEKLVAAIRDDHTRKRAGGIEYPEVDIVDIWRSVVTSIAGPVMPKGGAEIDCERLAIKYELLTNPVWPMPGLVQTLDRLATAGRLLGIISNAQFYTPLLFPALLDRSLDDLAFDPDMQYYSYRFGEAKPAETLYRYAAAGLAGQGIEPAETLYVGNDLLNDITPASRLGFRTALFAGDQRSLRLREGDRRVANVKPDLVVTDLNTLADCVLKP